jgi:NAD(P)-dependent dehydrogenase (short-subunit alcohol dehydrogenase family)
VTIAIAIEITSSSISIYNSKPPNMSPLWDMFRVTVFGSDNGASRTDTPAFDPAHDIPSLAGKTILITGAAGDLGRQTAIDLIRHGKPELVYVADLPRSEDEKRVVLDGIHHKVYGHEHSRDPAGDETRVRYLDLDLGSFESVRQCARGFLDENQRLDVLICNAGIIRMTPGTTADGYEAHFGINYLGHALLVRLLAPVLLRTSEREPEAGPAADVRIVLVSSEGHVFAPEGGVEFDAVKTDCAKMVCAFPKLIQKLRRRRMILTLCSPTQPATVKAKSPSSA